MKRVALSLTLLLFVLSATTVQSLVPKDNTISSYGIVNSAEHSGQIKILRQCFDRSGVSASEFASLVDVYQGSLSPYWNCLPKVQAAKAIRSEILTFVYYNTFRVWGPNYPSEYDSAKLQMFKDNNWLLKDASGNYVMMKNGAGYYADIGNSGFQAWLANWCKDKIDTYGLDGVSLDNYNPSLIAWYNAATTPINPRTGSPWSNQEICDAYKGISLKIRQVLGSGKIILVNGVWNGNRFWDCGITQYWQDAILNGGIDAIMSEGWMVDMDASELYSEEDWLDSINLALWLEDNFPSAGGKYFMTICTDWSFADFSTPGFPSDMTEEQYQQFATYCYASRLLTVKNLIPIMSYWFYMEYDYPQNLFKINIGTPSENYHTLGSSHVYARKFTGGMVLVNPTSSSYTVTIGSGYKNAIKGNSEPPVLTVPAHTGVILSG